MAPFPSLPSSRRWPKVLLHPSWLAGIISVGFHSALFASGPTFNGLDFSASVEPELADSRRQVPLIELSPAEQQQLPDFSRAFYNFDTLPPLGSTSEPLGNLGTSFLDNDAKSPPPPPSDSGSSRLPLATWNLGGSSSGLGVGPGASLPPITENTAPSAVDSPDTGLSPTDEAPDADTLPSLPAASQAGVSEEPGEAPAEPGASELTLRPTNPLEATPSPGPSETPPPEPTTDETARLRERLQASLAYREAGTTDEEATARRQAWREQGEAITQEAEDLETEALLLEDPIELSLQYGQRPCLSTPPGLGLIGLWVNAEGDLLAEPALLRSTGYPFIDQQAALQALAFIQAPDFEVAESFTGYQFQATVDYNPDTCVDLSQIDDRRDTSVDPAPQAAPSSSEADTQVVQEGPAEDSEVTPE